ncbi:preprotein translocase subunit TatA [Gammaproteobacteria bacterium]|jgi:genome maintenance exonuclease 1|nr:preprotein translocase subunit TatA [Gammaproteobacteria bacterium]MDC0529284.1 preprotein translocase subunit TatA [Gammaproteobacteria bacterium]
MINKFEYPNLERVDTDIGRHYLDSDNKPVPSVTTVLSGTSKSKDGLVQWRNRVGDEEADRIIKQSTDIGTAVHEAIEKFLNKEGWDNFENTSDQILAKNISNKFIKDALKGITEIWGLEVGLILDNLYAGTADCVGLYRDIPTLIDFKTAKKIKKRDWIEDYFLQGCAYANAHNVMFGTDIQQIVILMVDRNLIFQEYIVRPTEFSYLTRKWKNRLIEFNNKYNSQSNTK